MMKILMPLAAFETKESSESGINSKVVTGGIEKFSQNLYTSVPGIIPVEITKEDRRIDGHEKSWRPLSPSICLILFLSIIPGIIIW